jgi:hypothetical protein
MTPRIEPDRNVLQRREGAAKVPSRTAAALRQKKAKKAMRPRPAAEISPPNVSIATAASCR